MEINDHEKIIESIKTTTLDLLAYCKKDDWAGWDPYDALNSKLFELLPFLDFKIPRLVMIQLLKRSPINVRKPLLIPKTQNPKALALFLTAFLKLRDLGLLEDDDLIDLMIQKLIELRSPFDSTNPTNSTNQINPYWCWGYSFPWQTRDMLVPRGAPNLVCTTFVANALLDAYEAVGDQRCLDMAASAAEYIVNKLYYTEGTSVAGFCYPTPDSRSRVHNANFLGAAFLCRVYKHCGKKNFLENALKVARYSAAKQKDDGSWDYGEHATQWWIDNFHTGYNLCALRDIRTSTGIDEFEPCVEKGFQFYIEHFFREDGAPRYFHNRDYPWDTHCVAQSIITLMMFKDLNEKCESLALSVSRWSLAHLRCARGYFYYQITPYYRNMIPYIRWSQAWMLLALTILMEDTKHNKTK